jgi:hypothetical protein
MRGFGPGVRGGDVLKCLSGPCQNGRRAGCRFEPPQDHFTVSWIKFDQAGKPPRLLRSDQGRPGPAERIEDEGEAMITELIAPIDTPVTQSGSMPPSCKA